MFLQTKKTKKRGAKYKESLWSPFLRKMRQNGRTLLGYRVKQGTDVGPTQFPRLCVCVSTRVTGGNKDIRGVNTYKGRGVNSAS